MMDFSEFTDYVKTHITEHLPPEYAAADIRLDEVQKMNERYTGMTVRLEDNVSAPVVNMEMFYQQYQDDRSISDLMKDMADIVQMEPPASIDIESMKDYEQVKDKLFIRLNSAEGHEQIMAESPHRMEADLLMTYHIYIPDREGDGGFMSARITNDMMKEFGISQEQLHQDAVASTEQILKPKVQSMMEALTGIPEENPQMMVVTNEQGVLGASALFCNGIMDKAAEHMNGNYFVLPSSIHEMLVVPDNGNFNRTDLEAMVKEANRTVVEPSDRLSDAVYHYDSKDRVFERADTFENRMQEKSAERGSILGKLQDKKEQIERTAPEIGQNKQRQAGLAI